ncbi:peptide chain release factor N(5)-glutamine methyltransferase [Psychrobacter sp. 72-O-c]|uniref:peptide chain release factor N(5)-glutamine methyltransferase n=1 Tax=Psychrobacter sp. 72-O-c TaxID=2774125 RepID=UPI001918D9B2|nr:peptide chain release factor N(5)-glutamine methyltransferase [Psychrobacter sp. 72-O-c]
MTAAKTPGMTVKRIKQQVANTATDAGIPQFWITDWLLYVLAKPSAFLIMEENYQLTDSEFEQFNAGVTKMKQGIPLAYLTDHQEFWSLDFKVNEHTLIPRPDTEILVEQVLLWIKAQDEELVSKHTFSNKRLLDLGTGSGCIAISLAHELAQGSTGNTKAKVAKNSWEVVAADFSAEALKVAKHNAELNKVVNIEFVQSSWYDNLSTDSTQLFDVIVSNPPYIDELDEHLQRLQAEPISALSALNHGLADIEHIVEQAPRYLRSNGLLAIEHGFDQGAAVRQLFTDHGFDKVQTIQDFGGNERLTLGQLC